MIFNIIDVKDERLAQALMPGSAQVIPAFEVRAHPKFCGCKVYVSVICYITYAQNGFLVNHGVCRIEKISMRGYRELWLRWRV